MTQMSNISILKFCTLAIAIFVLSFGQAVWGSKISASQKRRVAARGHLTGTRSTQQIITWQTSDPSSKARSQAHFAIETVGPKPQTLWQIDGGPSYRRVDSIRVADLDGDGVPEIISLWWAEKGASLRVFHWDRTQKSFVELMAGDGTRLNGIRSYRIASNRKPGSKGSRLIVGGGEYELRGSEIVRAGGKMNEAQQGESGIEGIATIGPTKPGPIRQGESDTAPYKTALVVVTAEEGREVARFETGTDGRFRIKLPPGKYKIAPAPPIRRLPRAEEQTVEVLSGRFTQVTVAFDSGMR